MSMSKEGILVRGSTSSTSVHIEAGADNEAEAEIDGIVLSTSITDLQGISELEFSTVITEVLSPSQLHISGLSDFTPMSEFSLEGITVIVLIQKIMAQHFSM